MVRVMVVVDYENEWITEGSEYYVGKISGKIGKLNKLIGYCRNKGIPVVFTRHVEPCSKEEFAEGSERTAIIKEVDYREGEDVLVTKNKISSFYDTCLEAKLRELKADSLIVAGILTNLCVRSLVSDAYDRDYDVTVVIDACVAFSKEVHEFTLKDLKDTRPEIVFKTVEEFTRA